MSNDLAVQPAIVIFDKGRAEACGVAPVGVADPTFFAPITKTQREAGGVRGVTVNDAGQMVDAAGTVGGVLVEAHVAPVTGGVGILVGGKELSTKLGAASITYDASGHVSTHDGWTMTYDASGRVASQTKGAQKGRISKLKGVPRPAEVKAKISATKRAKTAQGQK